MATKSKKILLALPAEELRELDRVATMRHQSRSELIREALRDKYLRYGRSPETQARVEEAFRRFESIRDRWGEPFDSAREVRRMRDSR
jgi:metal-responsive CopG/Arc/MetJ family transcriptional regulator